MKFISIVFGIIAGILGLAVVIFCSSSIYAQDNRTCKLTHTCSQVYGAAKTCSQMNQVCNSQCMTGHCPCDQRFQVCMQTGNWPGGGGRPGKTGLKKI